MARFGVAALVAVSAFCLYPLSGGAVVLKADPDEVFNLVPDNVINDVFPGVTLSVNAPLGAVLALGAGNPGSNPPGFYPSTFGHYFVYLPDGGCGGCWSFGYAEFRADFSTPVDAVEIDFIDRYAGTAMLFAYNANGQVVATAERSLQGSLPGESQRVTLSVSVPDASISYVIAGANSGTYGVIDQLRWNVPAAAFVALLVPCTGPTSGGAWDNHGEYVSTVNNVARSLRADGLIATEDFGAIVSSAAKSDCGR